MIRIVKVQLMEDLFLMIGRSCDPPLVHQFHIGDIVYVPIDMDKIAKAVLKEAK